MMVVGFNLRSQSSNITSVETGENIEGMRASGLHHRAREGLGERFDGFNRGGEGEEVAKGIDSLTFPLRDELYRREWSDRRDRCTKGELTPAALSSLLELGVRELLYGGETASHWMGMKG